MAEIKDTPYVQHPLYMTHQNQVKRVSDVYKGIDSAKAYLQQYSQEESNEYMDRQDIATLDNFVFRTVEDIRNIIFRKDIDKAGITNKTVDQYSDSIDFVNNLNEFSKEVITARIRDGYTFVLVDSIHYDPDMVKNKAQQDAMNIRPYFVNVLRENVINWKKNAFGEYTQVTILETYDVETKYSTSAEQQVKVWRDDGTVEIWREEKLYDIIETGLTTIPIIKIGEDDIPPLYDLAKLNITHMNRDSEVSNYSRVGGAAFLAVFGNLADGDAPATLGINKGLKFNDKSESDVRWIEMEGTNYEMLKDRILYHEEQMNRVSASFTKEQGNKTATEVNKESMQGESKINDYATELEAGMNDALELLNLYKIDGAKLGVNTIEINKDFDSAILSPEMVASYRTDYMAGIISYEKLIELLVAGEYFSDMEDEEKQEEKARLADSGM